MQGSQKLEAFLGPSSEYSFYFTIAPSLRDRLNESPLSLADLIYCPKINEEGSRGGLPLATCYYHYHHDDEHLSNAEKYARARKWLSSETIWLAESTRPVEIGLSHADWTTLEHRQDINSNVVMAYVDLVVKRSIEDPAKFPLAFHVEYLKGLRPIAPCLEGENVSQLLIISAESLKLQKLSVSDARVLLTMRFDRGRWTAFALDIVREFTSVYSTSPSTDAELAMAAQVRSLLERWQPAITTRAC
jgi:hypothetical protein